tara:strand:- start:1413 stop:1658 length:246 start_codon:yes stop_codon:yes gene_type:complete
MSGKTILKPEDYLKLVDGFSANIMVKKFNKPTVAGLTEFDELIYWQDGVNHFTTEGHEIFCEIVWEVENFLKQKFNIVRED